MVYWLCLPYTPIFGRNVGNSARVFPPSLGEMWVTLRVLSAFFERNVGNSARLCFPFGVKNGDNSAQSPPRSPKEWMPDGMTTLRRSASLRAIRGDLPCRYPIFHPLTSREAEQLCASDHNNSNTLGHREAPESLSSLIILLLEPRASSSCNSDQTMTVQCRAGYETGVPRDVQGGVYPGIQ